MEQMEQTFWDDQNAFLQRARIFCIAVGINVIAVFESSVIVNFNMITQLHKL